MPNPPKIDPQRGARGRGPRRLPAEGRKGRAPRWPLPGNASPAETDLWAELWRTPQATAWDQLGWTRTVGRYCRVLLAAETLDAQAMSEARQLEDRLGLTPKAMRLLLWEISSDEVAEKRETKGVRGRLQAVG